MAKLNGTDIGIVLGFERDAAQTVIERGITNGNLDNNDRVTLVAIARSIEALNILESLASEIK